MPFTVRIAHQNSSFIVNDDESILDAALRQNFDMPHSCCEGICGSCAGQVIDGVVEYAHPEQLILDESERVEGQALFCSAYAASDLLIDMPGMGVPLHNANVHTYLYQLKSIEPIGIDIYQVLLLPEAKPLPYLAGQYVEVCLPGESAKLFSIAHAPNAQQLIELHIRCQSEHSYAQRLINHVKEHKTLALRGPLGNCFYHPKPKLPMILIAVGTGFAPLQAIVEQAFAEEKPPEIAFFWAGKALGDFYQLTHAEKWASQFPSFRLFPILDSPTPIDNWQGAVGNVLDSVLMHYPNLANHHIYFAGPTQLTLDALDRFLDHGAQMCYLYSDALDL